MRGGEDNKMRKRDTKRAKKNLLANQIMEIDKCAHKQLKLRSTYTARSSKKLKRSRHQPKRPFSSRITSNIHTSLQTCKPHNKTSKIYTKMNGKNMIETVFMRLRFFYFVLPLRQHLYPNSNMLGICVQRIQCCNF